MTALDAQMIENGPLRYTLSAQVRRSRATAHTINDTAWHPGTDNLWSIFRCNMTSAWATTWLAAHSLSSIH